MPPKPRFIRVKTEEKLERELEKEDKAAAVSNEIRERFKNDPVILHLKQEILNQDKLRRERVMEMDRKIREYKKRAHEAQRQFKEWDRLIKLMEYHKTRIRETKESRKIAMIRRRIKNRKKCITQKVYESELRKQQQEFRRKWRLGGA